MELLKRSFNPTERDLAMFEMIYRHRFLTGHQIKHLFFDTENTKGSYAHVRLSKLQKEKYLVAQPLLDKGLKQSSCYFLTQKGIDALNYENPRKAQKNKVERWQFPYYVFINDIFLSLLHYGWDYEESRELKARHNLNRRNSIHGVLYKNDSKFGLYTIPENATPRQLAFLKNSITECSRIAKISEAIVINRSNQNYPDLKKDCGCLGLHILPADAYLESILFLGNPELLIQHRTVGLAHFERSDQLYSHYDVKFRGKQNGSLVIGDGYIAQFLTNEQSILKFVKQFTEEEADRKKRIMGLFVWEDDTEIVNDPYFHRSQFRIVKVPRGSLLELFSKDQQKGGIS